MSDRNYVIKNDNMYSSLQTRLRPKRSRYACNLMREGGVGRIAAYMHLDTHDPEFPRVRKKILDARHLRAMHRVADGAGQAHGLVHTILLSHVRELQGPWRRPKIVGHSNSLRSQLQEHIAAAQRISEVSPALERVLRIMNHGKRKR